MVDKISQEFKQLRRKLLERTFYNLNSTQREAVFQVNGPVVVLAGAGSGKTTAIVSRIVNMISYGNAYMSNQVPENINKAMVEELKNAYDKGLDARSVRDIIKVDAVDPSNILAITFTNKAANELKSRICTALGDTAKKVCASTFHSFCVRVLREHAEKLGYSNHFVVYDEDDSLKVVKECQKNLKMDEKDWSLRALKNIISRRKDNLTDYNPGDLKLTNKLEILYRDYQKKLIDSDAMDFDDLIFNTTKLFKKFPEVLEKYQEKFKYILVDEYQDTNYAQYFLVSSLAKKSNNLCVVGDDDQSIYKFRGATIENIINFEKKFPGTKIIKFEQNYRSTQNILEAANAVIGHNMQRKGKTLWTQNEGGGLIKIHTAYNEHDEAHYISEVIQDGIAKGKKYSDFAVLYRRNSQSNIIEKVFMRRGITYRVYGGVRFYDRKEIRDMIAYLSVINNPRDEVRLKRIINQPRRSIGERTIAQAMEIAEENGKDLLSVMRDSDSYDGLKRVSVKLKAFSDLIDSLISSYNSKKLSISELYSMLLEKTGYIEYLRLERDTADAKIENVNELLTTIVKYEEEKGEEASLSGFLEEVSLFTNIDNYDDNADTVSLMTLHASKGLEFPVVFLPGFEEGIFPGIKNSENEENIEEIEEERRLAYVGITRCMKNLYILNTGTRMTAGVTTNNKVSRFISEIPEKLVEKTKSRDWKKLKTGESIPKSAQELRAQSVMAAHHFGGISGGFKFKNNSVKTSAFQEGDRVYHKSFGEGEIKSIVKMCGDSMLEIDFGGSVGSKRIMANYAQLEKR